MCDCKISGSVHANDTLNLCQLHRLVRLFLLLLFDRFCLLFSPKLFVLVFVFNINQVYNIGLFTLGLVGGCASRALDWCC